MERLARRMRRLLWNLTRWRTGWQLSLRLWKLRVCVWWIYGAHNPNRHRCGICLDWR